MAKWDLDTIRAPAFAAFFGRLTRAVFLVLSGIADPPASAIAFR